MGQKTPLYDLHLKTGAKIVDFSGWDMPIHYGSQIQEHHFVRQHAGMFDVSHMTVVDLRGEHCRNFLKKLLANNIDRAVQPGKAMYSCMLNERGGVIDDLIVYYVQDDYYRMVVNAATREKDLKWILERAQEFSISVEEKKDTVMIAVQGPEAREIFHRTSFFDKDQISQLKPFTCLRDGGSFIARTGYTGEDGYEIIAANDTGIAIWSRLIELGVKPIGLGARDTLRLEAGMNLYGTDMDETTTPLESGLSWTVAMEPEDRLFIGRNAVEKQMNEGCKVRFVGLLLEDKGVLRNGARVFSDQGEIGTVTSGSYSPTLNKSIAFARIAKGEDNRCFVEIRNKKLTATIVKPPFVRNGKACF